ncbi:MAG TPA: DUF2442 domain-containing protein [Solirubrobacteraceae bacterium]|nr:DUF2442 domain-containing protein [Solirubrobacteraceae bacterium]
MRSTPRLLDAHALDGHRVHVEFEDGISANIDLAHLHDHGGVFAPLRDASYFAALRVDPEGSTLVWPNGADVAPETLYAHAVRAMVSP